MSSANELHRFPQIPPGFADKITYLLTNLISRAMQQPYIVQAIQSGVIPTEGKNSYNTRYGKGSSDPPQPRAL